MKKVILGIGLASTLFASIQVFGGTVNSKDSFIRECLRQISPAAASTLKISCQAENPTEQQDINELGLNLSGIDISKANVGSAGNYYQDLSVRTGGFFSRKYLRISCAQDSSRPDTVTVPRQRGIFLETANNIDLKKGYYLSCTAVN